ncbi:MAG: hypothetical protein HYV27_16760 [Candidatus Hydrogenedentes bacterium]|nr:hypothetical protein [Candidatus Hydrogenedentota bacterium]
MSPTKALPGLHPKTFLLAALSLSVGWGVRGNFGHEYGAMLPGALTALAVCLMSGREDWWRRVPYFAFFGALGWGFGGSISYMQVIAYTHSGHWPSQAYGFFCLFLIGFLWAGMGGAGTAWPAVATREKLTEMFRPLSWIFAFWFMLSFVYAYLETREATYADATWARQASLLYWMDTDWIETLVALAALCCFDVWDRRFKAFPQLLGLGAAGAGMGCMVQWMLTKTGLSSLFTQWPILQYQVHPSYVEKLMTGKGLSLAEVQADALINWPNLAQAFPQHIGWVIGLLLGLGVYFYRYGKFRAGASLFLYMALGWFACFIVFPVLLGFGGAGFRMTPPRGDNWAGVLGVWIGTAVWLHRNNHLGALYASVVSGAIGGLGFSGAAFLKLLMVAPGNPKIVADPAIIQQWSHWQQANWHSFLEQSYGFINGIAIALAIGLLARVKGRLDDPQRPQRRWTEVFCVVAVLFGLIYVNMEKNVVVWTESKAVPAMMKLPLIEEIQFSAHTWFVLAYGFLAVSGAWLLSRHLRRRIPMIPETWLAKGQLFYVVFLWIVVAMNFERALTGFTEQRLLTEGVIFFNAVLCTLMMLTWPGTSFPVPRMGLIDYGPRFGATLKYAAVATLIAAFGMSTIIHAIYNGNSAGHAGFQKRFGGDALWKTGPISKSKKHS